MTRKLNLKFLACLLSVCAVLGVGGRWLRGYQVNRNAGALRQRAERATEAGKYEDAIREYRRYLALVPADGNARAEYGLALDRTAKSPQERRVVFEELGRALRQQTDREDVRRRIVHVAMSIGRFADARLYLEKLLERSPDNAELEELLGVCLSADGDYAKAAAQFERAVEHDPKQIESYVHLADLWRIRLNKAEQTVGLMDKMVKANESCRAYVTRARYYRQGGPGQIDDTAELTRALLDAEKAARLPLGTELAAALMWQGVSPNSFAMARIAFTGGPARTTFAGATPNLFIKAEYDLEKARVLSPEDAEVLLESAELERARRWRDQAQFYARRGLAAYPKDIRMYKLVADLAVLAGRREEAIACLRSGLKALPNEPQLPFQLADLLIQDGQLEEAARLMAQLKDQRIDPAVLQYLDGHCKVVREEWLEASKTLESNYPELVRRPELARQSALLLGKCYEELGDADQQYGAYRRVLTEDRHDPLWFKATEGVARALLAMNKVDDALEVYRRLIPYAPEARLIVIRYLIVRNMSLPEAQRQWREVDQLLAEAVRLQPKATEVAILQAQSLAARAQYLEAKEILAHAETELPNDFRVAVARAGLAAAEGKGTDALSILEDAEKRYGDHLELRMARARHYLLTADRDAAKMLEKLELGMDRFTTAEQQLLRRGLAEAYAAVDAPTQARRLWEQVARAKTNDLGVRIHLFDLALVMKDEDATERLLGEIRRLEGESGTLWRYCTAARLISAAEKSDKTGLSNARSLLLSVAARRPAWSRVPVCEARIEELSGNNDGAVPYYLRAIELGERNPTVLLKTIQLLCERQRGDEAYQVVRKLPEQAPLLQRMSPLVVDLAMRSKDTGHALIQARKAVSEKPTDYQNHLSLGRVYWALDRRKEAEESLRRSIQLEDKVPETWVTLVLFLVRCDRKQDAEALIAQMPAKLPLDKNRLAYAQCYVAVGQMDRARDLYRDALAAAPNDALVLRSSTEFAVRMGKTEEAKQYLHRLIANKEQAPGDAAAARGLLALLLVGEGSDYQPTRKALTDLGFVDQSPDSLAAVTVEEKRARAVILALQPLRSDKEEAIRTLEQIAKLQPLAASDQFLLAQLYKNMGKWPEARSLLLALLATGENNPLHLAYLARCLLQRNEPDEAQIWVSKLEVIQPKAWQTLELKARVLAANKRGEEAVALLVKFAAEKDAPLLAIGVVLEQIGQPNAAEGIYQKVVSASEKPETVLVMAGFLARTGRITAGLDVCDKARSTCPPEKVYGLAVAILYQSNSGDRDKERVARWIEESLKTGVPSVRVRSALQRDLAAVYNLQDRFQEAETIYRRCLEEDGHDALSMNNLAWLLATRGRNNAEALAIIQKAIDAGGPLKSYLDTRGTVYLAMAKSDLAVKDFEEVVANNPTGSGFFHLAQANYLGKNMVAARAALQQALKVGLKQQDLHPTERDKYEQLRAALDMR